MRPFQEPGKTYRKPLQLDESIADAHGARAGILDIYDWDHPAAEIEIRRAIELSPSNAKALLVWTAPL
jgi:hypothetical protein